MRYLILVMLIVLSACHSAAPGVKEVEMYNVSGDRVGTAMLSEQEGNVKIKLKLEGLSPGYHGAHIHEYAKCEGSDFKSAGNHLNPTGNEHGLMNPDGSHLGDLPNVEADSSGRVNTEMEAHEATLKDTQKSLLQGNGTSLIITEGQDDGLSQPGGNSGKRVVCGLIQPHDAKEDAESPTDPTEIN